MAKKVMTSIKLQIKAGQANPAPPVGPALGQHGLNIMEFCNAFNERTKEQMGLVIPVVITVFQDRSFSFITKTPPASVLIKKAIGLDKGSTEPGRESAGSISRAKLREIAEQKKEDLNAGSDEAAMIFIAAPRGAWGWTSSRTTTGKHGAGPGRKHRPTGTGEAAAGGRPDDSQSTITVMWRVIK